MDSFFRFAILCDRITDDGNGPSFVNVFNEIILRPSQIPFRFAPTLAVGILLVKPLPADIVLEIRLVWVSGPKGREPDLEDDSKTMVIPSGDAGILATSRQIQMTLYTEGIYVVSLNDPAGVFGVKNGVVAAYSFAIMSDSALAFENN